MTNSESSDTGNLALADVSPVECSTPADPSLTFESVTFSDGTVVEIGPNDVVVFVGPNNAGKSLALRELEARVNNATASKVFSSFKLERIGTPESFDAFVRKHMKVEVDHQGNVLAVRGYKMSLGGRRDLKSSWRNDISGFEALFCRSISTQGRITDSDPVNAIDDLSESPSHPIHLLYDDRVEKKISAHFRQAFGKDLILYRGGGRTSHLLVGEMTAPETGEDRVSGSFRERLLSSTERLQGQGDGMRSFASVILHLLASSTPSILLLDEPEAFLHPPQARLLGEIIAKEKSTTTQVFAATHSPDVLQGLISVAPEHLKVLRLRRDGNVNRVKELDKGLIQEISSDPLMQYSSVLSGVFHERVVICEADTDCMFYSSLLNRPEVRGEQHPDVLFVHSNGKHRMASLAKTLVSLDVPVQVVADLDVLNDTAVLRRIVEALGGKWSDFEPHAKAVKQAVEEQRPSLTVMQMKNAIQEAISQVGDIGGSLDELRRNINAQFGKASPWDAIKSAGVQALPPGEPTRHFQELQIHCEKVGLWIVPVGEVEGFCKRFGGHGPSWVQAVIEHLDLASDPELEGARQFVREMWGKCNQLDQLQPAEIQPSGEG